MFKKITLIFILIITAFILAFAVCYSLNKSEIGQYKTDKNVLIVYYSYSNHTKAVAEKIQKSLGCNIEEIKADEYKNKNVFELTKLVTSQTEQNYVPQTDKIDMSGYDVIFIGSPVWKGNLSLPVKSFLLNNDLKDKTIIPFYTFGGYVNKSNLDNKVKAYSHSKNVLPSFLTTYYNFSCVNFRLNKRLAEISRTTLSEQKEE